MLQENNARLNERLKSYVEDCRSTLNIPEDVYTHFNVKRGLRNADGTGVIAGATRISNVHGYFIDEYERVPAEGELLYRGYDIKDIINGCIAEDRFGFEEVVWLLLFGYLPDKPHLERFSAMLEELRELPDGFIEDMIIKAPSPNIMNKLGRSVLALYSYDDYAEDNSLENIFRQSIELVARISTIMVNAYQVKKRYYDHQSLFFHAPISGLSIAENILSTMRIDRQFTHEEARLLDICLMLHAEHGGGNNSTFTVRVTSSSGTDTYSSIAAAIGSLKGPLHGGANLAVMKMFDHLKENIRHWDKVTEIDQYLNKMLRKEAYDHTGLIYGIGHAVYTISDPRALLLKEMARDLAKEKEREEEYAFLELLEERAIENFMNFKGTKVNKRVCANVDFYSGFVYDMIGLPQEVFTPLFAMSRITGWTAHRIEELNFDSKRIIRPAYKNVAAERKFVPLKQR